MGKPPDLKRISKEDFPADDQELVGKLAFPLNSFMEQVRNLFDKNIDVQNLTEEYITLKVQTNSQSQPIAALSFKTNLKNKLKGVVVVSGNITSGTNQYLQQTPFISFSQNLSIVTINNISGLEPETSYDFLLRTMS